MSIFLAMLLGVVQGITEFLPVSSSGHLVLIQQIFGVETEAVFFDTMLHVGTLVSVCIVMWREILEIFNFKKSFRPFLLLVVATVPIVIVTLIFHRYIDAVFEGRFLGIGFLLTSIVLVVSELIVYLKKKKKPAKLGFVQAAVMGCMQAVSILPGLSRSGATISGGLASGLSRRRAAVFAFLMSVPAIAGSAVYQAYGLIKDPSSFDTSILLPSFVGMICAGIAGYIAVSFMINLIKKHSLYGFAIYTAVLGILVLLDQGFFHIVF